MGNLKKQKSLPFWEAFNSVRVKGVEPPRLAALDPKSSVSTNSTTPAERSANIAQFSDLQMDYLQKLVFCTFRALFK